MPRRVKTYSDVHRDISPSLPRPVVPKLAFSAWVGELVRRHRDALVAVSRAEGLLAEEALDAVQEAFATFMEKPEWRGLPPDTDDAPRLLTTLVRNHARNLRRRRWRKEEGMDVLTGSAEVDTARKCLDAVMVEAEEHLELTGCLETLKGVQRAVVTARFFEGASGLEVAAQLGITPGNVAVILHRARQSLRACLNASREQFSALAI